MPGSPGEDSGRAREKAPEASLRDLSSRNGAHQTPSSLAHLPGPRAGEAGERSSGMPPHLSTQGGRRLQSPHSYLKNKKKKIKTRPGDRNPEAVLTVGPPHDVLQKRVLRGHQSPPAASHGHPPDCPGSGGVRRRVSPQQAAGCAGSERSRLHAPHAPRSPGAQGRRLAPAAALAALRTSPLRPARVCARVPRARCAAAASRGRREPAGPGRPLPGAHPSGTQPQPGAAGRG